MRSGALEERDDRGHEQRDRGRWRHPLPCGHRAEPEDHGAQQEGTAQVYIKSTRNECTHHVLLPRLLIIPQVDPPCRRLPLIITSPVRASHVFPVTLLACE